MSREKTLAATRAAVADVLREKGAVTLPDVLVAMHRLTPARVEDWRFGRIPYLERAVEGSLAKLSAISREVRTACEAMGLEPRRTDYRSWGKGPKRSLRFSRSGEEAVERAYSTVWTSEAFRRGTHQRPPKPPKVRPPVLRPGVPIERDPDRVRQLEADKRDENLRLRAFLRMPYPELRAMHLRKEAEGYVFARLPCPLLDGTRCSCYADRPKDCRSYPHLQKKDMRSRLLGVLENAAVCPIVFSTLEMLKAELVEQGHDWSCATWYTSRV